MTPLAPCPSCRRHVCVDERACPFCGVSFEIGKLRARPAPDPRLGRAALLAWRITLGGSVTAACAGMPDESRTAATHSGNGGTGGAAVDAAATPQSAPPVTDAGLADAGPLPRMVPIYSDTTVMISKAVRFKPHSARVPSDMRATLEIVAQIILDQHRSSTVEVQGYADVKETRSQWLSEQRARAVRDRLIKLGVARERLITKGYGTSKPEVIAEYFKPEQGESLVLFKFLDSVPPSDAGGAGD